MANIPNILNGTDTGATSANKINRAFMAINLMDGGAEGQLVGYDDQGRPVPVDYNPTIPIPTPEVNSVVTVDSEGDLGTIPYSSSATASGALVVRGANGHITVPAPASGADATTKIYVDGIATGAANALSEYADTVAALFTSVNERIDSVEESVESVDARLTTAEGVQVSFQEQLNDLGELIIEKSTTVAFRSVSGAAVINEENWQDGIVLTTSASPVVLVLAPELPVGATGTIMQGGVGSVTISGAVAAAGLATAISAQYQAVQWVKTANAVILFGALANA